MIRIPCDQSRLLKGLAAELGVSTEQHAANVAVDLFGHCLARITENGNSCHVDLNRLHIISPSAMTILRLTGTLRRFKTSMGANGNQCAAKETCAIILAFDEKRSAAVRDSERLLGQKSERILSNAITLLGSALAEKRNGRSSLTVYKRHSVLHAKTSRAVTDEKPSSRPAPLHN
jgi:hypothetical protein